MPYKRPPTLTAEEMKFDNLIRKVAHDAMRTSITREEGNQLLEALNKNEFLVTRLLEAMAECN